MANFSLNCGRWACGCMNEGALWAYQSCSDALIAMKDLQILYETSALLAAEAEAKARATIKSVPATLPDIPAMAVSFAPKTEHRPRHNHSNNGPCKCDNLSCKNRHLLFADHKCCTWVESKNHSCNSTTTHEVVINGVTCISCEVGIHRPGLNTWKP